MIDVTRREFITLLGGALIQNNSGLPKDLSSPP
jgi:hypothetical protein